jgi:hypothetical protein
MRYQYARHERICPQIEQLYCDSPQSDYCTIQLTELGSTDGCDADIRNDLDRPTTRQLTKRRYSHLALKIGLIGIEDGEA